MWYTLNMGLEPKQKRGRPKGSKNKKTFENSYTAKKLAANLIAAFGIDGAKSVAQKILEIIRASKANLNEKYPI